MNHQTIPRTAASRRHPWTGHPVMDRKA